MWAAMEVLRGERKPMTAAEIRRDPRAQARPGPGAQEPEQTLAAQLAVNAKRGRYVERIEPGKFRLKREA